MIRVPTAAAKITTTTIGTIIAMTILELLLFFFDRLQEVPSEQSFALSPTLMEKLKLFRIKFCMIVCY
jgi:hypothetical protein